MAKEGRSPGKASLLGGYGGMVVAGFVLKSKFVCCVLPYHSLVLVLWHKTVDVRKERDLCRGGQAIGHLHELHHPKRLVHKV